MAVSPRYQVRAPDGAVQNLPGTAPGGFYDDLQSAVDACATRNAAEDPAYQYVVVAVIHPDGS